MNSSIAGLRLSSLRINSPAITSRSVRDLRGCSFFGLFSPALLLKSKYCAITSTSFASITDSAVVVDSDAQNTAYTSNQAYDLTASSFKITKCLFLGCGNSNANGGGASIGLSSHESNVQIVQTGFRLCAAKLGAAFYCNSKSLYVSFCCFYDNSADDASLFWSTTNDNTSCANCFFTKCKSSSATSGIKNLNSAKEFIRYCNITSCTTSVNTVGGLIASSVSSYIMQYNLLDAVSSYSAMRFLAEADCTIQLNNFVGNTGNSVVYADFAVYIYESAFLSDLTTSYRSTSCSGTIDLEDCTFSLNESEVSAKLHTGDKASRGTYNQATKTVGPALASSDHCWDMYSATPESSSTSRAGLTSGSIALISIAILVLVGIVGFAGLKLFRRMYGEDTTPLMYTA